MDDDVRFSTLHPDGSESDVRHIQQADIGRCPWLIMAPEHYREDGTCRCDDPTDPNMVEWGYVWNGKSWGA